MSTDPLLPGFDYLTLHTSAARLRVAVKGSGPPLLLLHGYPQTHLAWHRIAPRLAEDYSVVLADLRGYGESRALDEEGADYSKAALARDQLETMGQLGFERFAVIGHDRGARVGYRLALDHPQAVAAFVSLTVVPILDNWAAVNKAFALNAYHWFLLAQPYDLPERLIGADPEHFLDYTLRRMAQGRDIYHPQALESYRRAFRDPAVRHAMCEDYRAAVGVDADADQADRDAGRRLQCPVQVLWQERPYAAGQHPLEIWKIWAGQVEGAAIGASHMLPEDAPDAVLEHLLGFLASHREALRTGAQPGRLPGFQRTAATSRPGLGARPRRHRAAQPARSRLRHRLAAARRRPALARPATVVGHRAFAATPGAGARAVARGWRRGASAGGRPARPAAAGGTLRADQHDRRAALAVSR